MGELTHLSLFSGIGGLDLAAEWAGFKTVGQCEWADYPTKVLEKHWPDVERWRDIRTLTKESFYERTGLHTVDIVSGGFPCQPFSYAGKQRSKEDDRYLWPEMARVIAELRPAWVVGENVAGIIKLALDDVLFDLESKGYATRTFLIPACGVGAPHQRYRTAIVVWNTNSGNRNEREKQGMEKGKDTKSAGICCNVSNPDSTGCQKLNVTSIPDQSGFGSGGSNATNVADANGGGLEAAGPREQTARPAGTCQAVSDSDGTGRKGSQSFKIKTGKSQFTDGSETLSNTNNPKAARYGNHGWEIHTITESERPDIRSGAGWWAVEPELGRVAYGIPNRVDRLKCLGNAVVPQQFYPIFQAIADIEHDNY